MREKLPTIHESAEELHLLLHRLRRIARRGKVQRMSKRDPVKAILTPFLVHGLCKNEAEALQMLAKDYVQRQVRRYGERVEHFHTFYQTSVQQFAQQVTALCQGASRSLP